ncbi:MAG: DUF3775 domain-containing protein [Pseudooceanicola sp.]
MAREPNSRERASREEAARDPVIEEMVESFPASDPPGWTGTTLMAGHPAPGAEVEEVEEMPEPELSVPLVTVCYLVQLAHDLMGKAESTSDADSAEELEEESEMTDMILEDRSGDAVEDAMRSVIADLDDEAQVDLVALMWLGRDDSADWAELRALAESEDNGRTEDYLLGTPLLADYLLAGLDRLGLDCTAWAAAQE